jgi:hypothetical protein
LGDFLCPTAEKAERCNTPSWCINSPPITEPAHSPSPSPTLLRDPQFAGDNRVRDHAEGEFWDTLGEGVMLLLEIGYCTAEG